MSARATVARVSVAPAASRSVSSRAASAAPHEARTRHCVHSMLRWCGISAGR